MFERLSFIAGFLFATTVLADDFPEPVNTQAPGEHPPSPEEMLDLFELPDGFNVTLFAGEPDVQQPIAFDFDDRGRLWVAENYTYSARGEIAPNLRDRIVILEDTDWDGRHDVRKVFWDEGRMLTSLTWGFGGLWILNNGTLSFIPDKDGDDVPDSEPVEMLNGWTMDAGHNFVNGLLWGPDGWLYGRHGITDTSYAGTPDTPLEERQPLNCGIWRFHPTKHTFEVVCHGTTNPWGLDYNEYGDMFMTNNVIGHLWHVIPGAHYERMFGRDFNPHLYELMGMCADHYHWDNTGGWQDSRDGKAADLGGGHSHSGLMIYQGQNFPEEYRGKAFMCNTHGRCVNVDRLERKGSTYVAKHEPNFLKVNTPWFRGVELKYGPAGCVYLSDWSDNGECHDHDGVHRTSGRIYRISYGDFGPTTPFHDMANKFHTPLADRSASDLILRAISQQSIHEWERRKSLRLVIEKFESEPPADKADILTLLDSYWSDAEQMRIGELRRFNLFAAIEALNETHLAKAIISQNPHIRMRALEYVASHADHLNNLHGLLDAWIFQREDSPAVLGAFASAVQRYARRVDGPLWTGFPSQSAILKLTRSIDGDPALQLMTWYAIERLNELDRNMPSAAWLGDQKLREFQVRWIASDWTNRNKSVVGTLRAWLQMVNTPPKSIIQIDEPIPATRGILRAIADGMKGQINLHPPDGWEGIGEEIARLGDRETNHLWAEISSALGDKAALSQLRELVKVRDGDHLARSNAVQSLAELRDVDSIPTFISLLNDRAVYVDVARALASFDDPRIPEKLLQQWKSLRHGAKEAAIDTLVSRKSYALELANAMIDGRADATELTAAQVRQLLAFNDPRITDVVEEHWGIINDSTEAKAEAIESLKQRMTDDILADADLDKGAALFKKTCANCHKLYGDGGKIGPDLTGGNRANMDYLLGNIIDPSAEVPRQFTTSVVVLESGRVITGVVVAETANTVTLQTDKEELVIANDDIEERVRTNKSLMPDGLLDSLTDDQVRDLIGFVRHRR